MKLHSALLLPVLAGWLSAQAELIEFDLSPPGTDAAVGLHPLNEVIPGASAGSGGEAGFGIAYDLATGRLTFDLAYGSAFGFSDLTGPAFAWLLHGPSPVAQTAPVMYDLAPYHAYAPDPARGGRLTGTLLMDAAEGAGLLAGWTYLNIYTPALPGGELRGQLVPIVIPESGTWLPGTLLLLLTLPGLIRRGRRKTPPGA